jgi:hypothetical protein
LDAVVCSNFYNVQCRLSKLTLGQKPSPLHNPKDLKSFFILKRRICGDLALYWLHLCWVAEDIKKLTPSPTANPLRAFFIVGVGVNISIFFIFTPTMYTKSLFTGLE